MPKAFEMCLKSNHQSSLDHKIVKEASDGLQKAQVASRLSFWYRARFSTKLYTKV
jgi:DnaJ family protein C protein 7